LLLVAVGLCVALGVPAAYFGGRRLLVRRIQSWRQEGFAAAAAGDKARAADVLLRYLKRRPGDVEALRRYAGVREAVEMPDGRHLTEAVGALQLLLGEEPESLDDRRHLLELYVRLERRPEALDTAEAILRRAPGDVRTAELKTEVLLKSGRDREALAAAQQWCKAAPLELKAHMARLALRARVGHPPSAVVADAAGLRQANPGDARFEILQGFAHGQVGEDEEAARRLKSAAHTVTDAALAKTLIEQLDALGMCDDSLAVLEGLVARGGGAELRHALGRRLWELGRWKESTAALADVSPADPGADATLLAIKALALAEQKLAAEAEACRAALVTRQQQAEARAWTLLLRRTLHAAGNSGAAINTAAATAADNRQVVAECRAALALDPQNAYLDYHVGEAQARLGELDLAVESWRRAVVKNPAWAQPAVRLVDALLGRGQPEQALRIATGAARRNPLNAASVIALSRAWAAGVEAGRVGQSDELLRLVEQVQKQMPGEEKTLLVRVQVEAQAGRKEQAAAAARQALAQTPAPSEGTLLALSAISRRAGLGLERECFDRSEAAHGVTPSLTYARAVDRYIAGDAAAGLKLIGDAAARSGATGDAGAAWLLLRTQYLDLTGDPSARRAWAELVAAFPDDLSVQQAAASARAVRGDWEFQEPVIERLRRLGGDGALAWRLARARLMVEFPRNDGDYAQGSVLLSQIIREVPALPEPHVLMARALVRMNRVDAAIEHLQTAAKYEPTSVSIALQLAGLHQSRNDFERVRQELERVGPHMHRPEQRQRAAMLLAQQGNQEQAVKLLEEQKAQQVAGAPSSGEDLLLAVLYRRNGQVDKAEAALRRLLEQEQPPLAAVELAVLLYAGQGRRAEAEKVLARLEGMKLEPGVKNLAWGSYRAQLGEVARAAEHYRAATAEAPANAAAWRVLIAAEMAQGMPDAARAAVEAARRALPSDKGLAYLDDQFELLREAAADAGLLPVVLSVVRDPLNSDAAMGLVRIVVDGRRSNDADRLASRLRQLADEHRDFLPARLQLIQCYRSSGRPADALTAAKQAMGALEANPASAKVVVQVAAEQERWQDVLTAAQAWKQRAPAESLPADVAAARAQVGLGQAEAALERLKPHLPAAAADPDQNADLVTVRAMALAACGRGGEAAELLWPLAGASPQWRARWVQVALVTPDVALAEQWLDRVATIVPPGATDERVTVAEGYDRVARRGNGPAEPRLVSKSSEAFKAVVSEQNAPPGAVLAAAVQAERAGDIAAAEQYYRRVVRAEPKAFVAHNNLAMLLAARGGNAFDEAVASADAAVKLQPRQAAVYDTLAFVQAKAGNARAAAATMKTAADLEPTNAKWRVRLAQYLFDSGEPSEAAKVIDTIDSRRLDLRQLPPAVQQQLGVLRKLLRERTTGKNTRAA
jgi:tetratricopeptide (TPR) repeat protein